MNIPEQIQRRDFIKQLGLASTAALVTNGTQAWGNDVVIHPKAKADSCILIWMAGGMAAPDTFDPKRYLPFEKGLEVNKILSTFPAIDTNVDGIKISQGLENIAQVMDRGTLIRSAVQPDLGSILHSRHQYHWHTGYVPPITVAAPHLGAWMAKVLGPKNEVIPPFINIGQRLEGVGEKEELKAFTTAGFFGSEYGPMNLPYPEQAVQSVQPPKGMEPGRFSNRYKHFKKLLDQNPNREQLSDFQRESMLRSMESAIACFNPRKKMHLILPANPRIPTQSMEIHALEEDVCWPAGWWRKVPALSK